MTIDAPALIDRAEEALAARFREVDRLAMTNQRRVIDAFAEMRLSEEFFAGATGYGRNDAGRDVIDRIFARAFQAERAAVRMQMVSGTHALACALLGNLRAGDRLASLTGHPYDTMEEVIGLRGDGRGSLKDAGISYSEHDVMPHIDDPAALRQAIAGLVSGARTLAYIQKSRGYSFQRQTVSNRDIEKMIGAIRSIDERIVVMVDNCYGEFVEDREPPALGADLIAGSMIKNPGGGLAIAGGYVAGRGDLVERALIRLTAPGIGGHLGITFDQNRRLLQGLFMAPSVVSQALKGAMLFALVFQELGFNVSPGPFDERSDIIQAIELGTADRLLAFCRAIQKSSPVDAHVVPEPDSMPGYEHKVVMAGGSFVEGSTIELSADGPLRAPYAAYLQGGLSYLHVKHTLHRALELAASGDCPFLPG